MKFTKVEIQNFLTIGEASFTLDALGLVHIGGENLDETSAASNGAGKSSIADAICWCLWGSTAREVTGDDVVNTTEGKNCAVSVTIDDDGEQYKISRHRKHKTHKNVIHLFQWNDSTSEWEDRTKGTNALTQKAIERLLGTSETVFNSAVYFGQESIPDIPSMTDRQLKILVEQAAGVDVLTNAYEVARQRHRVVAEKRAQAQINLDRIVDRHGSAIAFLARLSDQEQQWETQHAVKVRNLKLDTENAIAEYTKAKSDFDPSDAAGLKASIAECEEKIAAVTDEQARERLLQDDLSQAERTLQHAQSSVAIAERQAKQQVLAVRDAKENVEATKKGVGKPCNSCSRPLEEKHLEAAIRKAQDAQQEKEDKLRAAAGDLQIAKSKLPPLEKAVAKCRADLEAHRAGMTDVSAEGDKLKNFKREMQLLEAVSNEIERLKQKAQRKGEEWKGEIALANPFTDSIVQANDDIRNIALVKKDAEGKLDDGREEEMYAQAVVDVFAPNGVRAHRLDEATPFLNERTAHYLGSLADGAIEAFWTTISENKSKDRLIEKFSVTVEKQGSAPSFKALSGGEKRKVRLSCALALQDLVAARAPKSIDLWCGDEIDDALDDPGLERLMSVLEEKARERGTVLIISHNDIAHYARKTMTVTKKGGKSTVVVS